MPVLRKSATRRRARPAVRATSRSTKSISQENSTIRQLRSRLERARTQIVDRSSRFAKAAANAARGIDVKGIRRRLKMTPAKFATLLGVGVAALAVMERRRVPKSRTARLIKDVKRRGRALLK